MWWKLVGLGVVVVALIFAVIPVRTSAVVYDPMNEPSPGRVAFTDILGGMYLTPGTTLFIIIILAVAGFLAFKVLRRRW